MAVGVGLESFDGKVAVVTGGASGIGAGLAGAFAAAGCAVALADIDEMGMIATATRLRDEGATVEWVACDVTSPARLDDLADTVERRLGPVDIVCNNAGVAVYGALTGMSLTDWRFVMDINFWGVVHGIHTFVPRFVERGTGYVVNTASMAGLVGMEGLGVYNASKFAVVGLSEALSRELAPHGIGVSVICPMIVDTPINENSMRAWAHARGDPEPEIHAAAADAGSIPPGMRGGSVDVAQVTTRTLEAMREGDLYVLTHASQRGILARRAARLEAAARRVETDGA